MMQKNKSNTMIEDVYPLSPMQEGMLFHSLYAPNSGIYVLQWSWIFADNLDVAAFEQAWRKVIERHTVLRTAYVWKKVEKLLQVVHRQVPLPWKEYDWRDMPGREQQERLDACLRAEREQGFDLSCAPLMHLTLVRLGEAIYHFTWSFHHILLDGWSTSLLLHEVFAYYEALKDNQELALPAPHPYRDYIAWLQGQNLEEARHFWQRYLADFDTPTPLIVEKSPARKSEQAMRQQTQELQLTEEATSALQQFARQHRLTMNTLVQGAWALLLSRYSGRNDVVFGIATSGRPVTLDGVEQIIGLFINTLPLRARLEPDRCLLDWLQELQMQQLEAQQYAYSPLVQIQEWSEIPSGQPLFESLLGFENFPDLPSSSQGEPQPLAVGRSSAGSFSETNYPICIMALPDKELSLQIIYDSERFAEGTITSMLDHVQTLLTGFLACGERGGRLRDLSLLTAAQRQHLLVDWNRTARPYPATSSLPELFEAQVARTPDAIALVCQEQHLSYATLNRSANQLGRLLVQAGVEPDQPVAFCLSHSPLQLIAVLAILKAGGAYLPLDLSYPPQRLELMLADAQVDCLLTEEAARPTLQDIQVAHLLSLDQLWSQLSQQPGDNLALPLSSQQRAYVIYTSGSTGIPKGVVIPHQAVSRLVCETDYLQILPTDRVAQASNVSFDAATFEIWGALLNGACLIGVSKDVVLSPQALATCLHEQQISALFLTTALFNQMVQEAQEGFGGLRCLLFGGEAADPRSVRMLLGRGRPQRLLHVYGPTENTTYSTWYAIEQVAGQATTIPIGRPIANSEMYVLDDEMELVPVGTLGELYVGGAGLAQGYLRRPELTAERFVPHPFSAEPGSRLYKTGDVVKALPDGNVDFVGRKDQQVKIHGFRIEPGEVAAVLQQHAAVRQALVMLREDRPGDKRLVAYIVPHPHQLVIAQELRAFLGQHLPDHMVPAFYIRLDELPLTPNGKVDRRMLPMPEDRQQGTDKEFVAARDPLETQLTQMWEELLNVQPIGVHDNFFDIGGHSLHAVSLIAKIQKRMDQKLPLSVLFQQPTIEQLAYQLRQQKYAPTQSAIVAIQPHGSRLPFFAVHPGSGDVFCYYNLARAIGFEQPFYALEDPDIQREDFPCIPLEVMAARYIKALRDIQPQGPYLLGGFSFGGHVAFEMAQQLQRQGHHVALLAIFDTAIPAIVKQMPHDEANLLTTVIMELLQDSARKSAQEMYGELQKLTPDERFAYALEQVQSAKVELPGSSAGWLRLQVQIFRTRMQVIQDYDPQPYAGQTILFRSSQVEEFGDVHTDLLAQPDYGWHELASQLEVYTVEGYHDTLFLEPQVQVLAEHVKACLDKAQIAYQGVIS